MIRYERLQMLSLMLLACFLGGIVSANGQTVRSLLSHEEGFVLNSPIKETFEHRASPRQFADTPLSEEVVSSLLWAANGINRPESGRRTAPSALNAQDVDVYLADNQGVWLYEPKEHRLRKIVEGDHRLLVAGSQADFATAPVFLLLVSDISRFRMGEQAQRLEWAALDAGMVAQNVLLFCASEQLACRPRSWMEKDKLRRLLEMSDSQHLLLNIPVAKAP